MVYGSDILYHGITEVIIVYMEKKRLLKAFGFRRESTVVKACKCPLCSEIVDKTEFRNKAFLKEFETSGLCQGCQDSVFGYRVAW